MTTRTRVINYNALVRKQVDYRRPDTPEYMFSNGKKFKRGDNRGVYNEDLTPPVEPAFINSLDFSDTRNNQYIGLI